jgi:tetratricopeptide (TPR) repeat protein
LREVSGSATEGANYLAVIAIIEGDRERACRHHRELLDTMSPDSEALAATYELPLARDLCYLGRYDEVEPLLRHARSVPQGPVERSLGSSVEALLLAARGRVAEAEALARTGITAAAETDNSLLQAWSYEDLSTVLERAGRVGEAREELERALTIWEQKGCLPCADRIRAEIDSLGRAAG